VFYELISTHLALKGLSLLCLSRR